MNSAPILFAGMPSPIPEHVKPVQSVPELTRELTHWSMDRIDTISFFLFVILVAALLVMFTWNLLAQEVRRLPKLSFKASCAAVFLWSLTFVIVLTMISGARELMTPGAWEKDNYTYKLREKHD